jgi:hypothetical protein
MRFLVRLGVLALAAVGAKSLYERFNVSSGNSASGPSPWGSSTINLGAGHNGTSTPRDTATGTDPNAKYAQPGYEDKSLGQAVNQDQQLVDRLLDETGGDTDAAQSRFSSESAGAPALARQERDEEH